MRAYVTLVRWDVSYYHNIGPVKKPIKDYKNIWGYLRELNTIPAFHNNSNAKTLALDGIKPKKPGEQLFRGYNERILAKVDFDALWADEGERRKLSQNPDSTGSDTAAADTNTDNQIHVRVIKGVTGGSLAPYMYIDENNELTGVDIEIAKEVFERIFEYDLEIEVADTLQGVLSGQYDIAINNYGYTDTRAESYYFSYPYKTTYNVYIQRPDDTPLTSLQDIADREYKIELDAGGLTANALEQWNEDNPEHQINIVYTETNFQIKFEHLLDKTADAAIDDGPVPDTLLGKFGLEGQLVGNEIDPETADFLFPQNNTYFLFGKNDDGYEIREKVDEVLKEMKEDGTLAEITTKYFNRDTSPKTEYFESTRN